MKNKIKKWLGIDEIEDALTAPEKGFEHIGGEIDLVDSKIDKLSYLKNFVECFTCGSLFRLRNAKQLAVFSKDIQRDNTLNQYTLFYAVHHMQGNSNYKEPTETIFFCPHCPVKNPTKVK